MAEVNIITTTILNPQSIAPNGLQMWLRSDSGVVLNGSTVSAWTDLSGNGNNATQSTQASQPAYITSNATANGYPTIRLTASGQVYLQHALGSVASNFTVFLVVCSDTGSGATNFQCVYGNSGGVMLLSNGAGTSGDWGSYLQGYIDSGHTILDNGLHSCTWVCPTPTGTQTYCTDGTIVNISGGSAYNSAAGYIGQGGGGTQGVPGDLVELAVWNTALNNVQLGQLHAYCKDRYGAG